MKKFFGFTLAEVLITLGIIGVITAITIPTLIQNYKKHVVVTKLKKSYADFNHAFMMVVAENGTSDLPISYDLRAGANDVYNYLRKYLNVVKECQGGDTSCFPPFVQANGSSDAYIGNIKNKNLKTFILQSGVSGAIWTHDYGYKKGWLILDIDGPKKGPSVLGRDIFAIEWQIQADSELITYSRISDAERETLISDCKSKGGFLCSLLIIKDGWTIKSDYPLKL